MAEKDTTQQTSGSGGIIVTMIICSLFIVGAVYLIFEFKTDQLKQEIEYHHALQLGGQENYETAKDLFTDEGFQQMMSQQLQAELQQMQQQDQMMQPEGQQDAMDQEALEEMLQQEMEGGQMEGGEMEIEIDEEDLQQEQEEVEGEGMEVELEEMEGQMEQ